MEGGRASGVRGEKRGSSRPRLTCEVMRSSSWSIQDMDGTGDFGASSVRERPTNSGRVSGAMGASVAKLDSLSAGGGRDESLSFSRRWEMLSVKSRP